MAGLVDRMVRAAKLDVHLYEEVEADSNALGQAMSVVVFSSVAAGIGASPGGRIDGGVLGIVAALVGWYVWAYITYIVGTRFLPEAGTKADLGQLLRTTGFSSSPGVVRVLGIFPGLAGLAFSAASIWMLLTMVVAVRQALDYRSTARAVGVCLIGWVVQALIIVLLFYLLGRPGMGVEV